VASLGAFFAMIMRMSGTLFSTCFANINAKPALLLLILTIQAHELGSETAYGGAFNIGFYAIPHHIDIWLPET